MKEDGSFVFDLTSDNPRSKPTKVMLGSMEFPMVQQTLESSWNRVYFCERIRLSPTQRRLDVEEQTDGDVRRARATLPLYLNRATSLQASTRDGVRQVVVSFEHAHGLWAGDRCLLPYLDTKWGQEAWLLGTPLGAVSLTRAHSAGALTVVDEMRVAFATDVDIGGDAADGFLHVPGPDGPTRLCELLEFCINAEEQIRGGFVARYDTETNRVGMGVRRAPARGSFIVHVGGDLLAVRLGLSASGAQRRFQPPTTGDLSSGVTRGAEVPPLAFAPRYDVPPFLVPSEGIRGWAHVQLPVGWYTPTHRPMATGLPRKLTTTWDQHFNRFFLAPREQPYHIVFIAPTGRMHAAALPFGRYTPATLCDELALAMNSSQSDWVYFSVQYDALALRFAFRCVERVGGAGDTRPIAFSLLFNHPLSIDATRVGFDELPYEGGDEYVSAEVVVPRVDWPPVATSDPASMRLSTNMYHLSELTSEKTFRIASSSPPPAMCMIVAYDASRSEILVSTHFAQMPGPHGLRRDEVIAIQSPGKSVDFVSVTTDDKSIVTVLPATLERRVLCVTASPRDGDASFGSASHMLRVRVGGNGWAGNVGRAVVLHVLAEPCSFNFSRSMPSTITGTRLGFRNETTESHRDGNVKTRLHMTMPMVAPHVHALDHPDYVLIYLGEGKQGTLLQHQNKNNTTTPFVKLVLYPLYKEERMLPRDTTMLSGESLTRVSIRFRNPDGTKYEFHGASFSFNLNFVV